MAKRRGERWAYLTRAGSERDVIDELGAERAPELLAEGLVGAGPRVPRPDGSFSEPAFARQAMRVHVSAPAEVESIASALADAIKVAYPQRATWQWSLQIVSPDSRDPRDPRRRTAAEIDEAIAEVLDSKLPRRIADAFVERAEEADRLAQVWFLDRERALVGFTAVDEALTRVAGGRLRLARSADMPSRSALKLVEAIAWIGLGPERGDRCADLGSGPGGWTSVAANRGARVVAVDSVPLAVDLPRERVRHVAESAYKYVPEDTLDWLLCDVAHRPLEVAKLVAKWGRRVWARQVIANFKLPMKKKAEVLRSILGTLEAAGWRGLRARQLFYDRDEVTVFAWLDPKLAVRGYRPPFEREAREKPERRKERAPRKRSSKPR